MHIDTTPPVITEVYIDKSSDTGASDSDSITNDNTVTFKGVAEKGNLIELKIFSVDDPNTPAFTFNVTVSAADGSFSIDTSTLPDGTYYWQMVATDAAGNLSDAVKGAMPLIVDTSIAEFSAGLDAGSDSGDSSNDAITNQNTAQLSGKGEVGATVTLNSLTNSTTGESISIGSLSVVVGDDGKWQLQLPELSVDGVYNWSVTISDIAGNSQTLTGSFTLDTNIDFTGGLDSSSDSGDNSDLVTNIAEPIFSGAGTDGDKITVQLTGPDGYSQTLTTTVQNGVWEVTFADLAKLMADGTYSWVITATDIAGNSKELTGDFTFDSTPLDIDAKLLSDSGFDNADNITNSETLQIQVNVNDTASSVRLVVWPAAGSQSSPAFEQTLNFAGGNQYLFDVAGLDEGEYQYSVFATDIAGNVSQTSPITITIDRTPPAIDDAILDAESDTSLVPGENYSSDTTPSFSGKSEAGARITIEIFDKDGKPVAVEPQFVVADENGKWQFVLSTELADGDYTWVASAFDAAGNKSSSPTQTLHIDTTPPVIIEAYIDKSSDTGASDTDSITNDNTVTFKGVAEKGNLIELKIFSADDPNTPAFTFNVMVSAADGSFSIDTSALPDGTYYWQMVATDAAGNL
ncbi:MAG: Ig-like domain-containing protein, partial [Plesiomonas shigelloides]